MFLFAMLSAVMFYLLSVGISMNYDVERFHQLNAQYHANNISIIADSVKRHASENPSSLSGVSGTFRYPAEKGELNTLKPEFRHLAFHEPGRYTKANGQFRAQTSIGTTTGILEHRLAIWLESPLMSFEGDDYLKVNPCETDSDKGKGINASYWCGRPNSLWAKIESGETAISQIEAEQQRLYRLSRKFFRFYGAERTFTVLGEIGTSKPLFQYTGYLGVNAENCSGNYFTNSVPAVPLDCSELFNPWGKPLYLHILGENHAVVTNVLGIEHTGPIAAGQNKPIRLAEDMYIQTK